MIYCTKKIRHNLTFQEEYSIKIPYSPFHVVFFFN